MYIDLIAPDSYINVNRTLATMFGLSTAVYVAELSNILVKVKQKKSYDENGFFTLNRRYMKDRTTLGSKEQKECEAILVSAGVMAVDPENEDRICVSVEGIVGLVAGTTVREAKSLAKNVNAEVKKEAKEKRAEASKLKKENVLIALKKHITETKPILVEKMGIWIETCINARKRQVTKAVVEAFEAEISKYDEKSREQIIDHAITYQYSDATWSINMLIRQGKLNKVVETKQKKSDGITAVSIFS